MYEKWLEVGFLLRSLRFSVYILEASSVSSFIFRMMLWLVGR